jgi:hypothetical protein
VLREDCHDRTNWNVKARDAREAGNVS